MKLAIGLLLVVILVVALFVLGFVLPRRSRKAQEKLKQASAEGEQQAEKRAGRVGDRTAGLIGAGRWLGERAAHAGRVAHDKLFGTGRGANQERVLRRTYGEGSERGEGPRESEPGH